jgi:hypothetical protein
MLYPDPDPVLLFNADPDPALKMNADPYVSKSRENVKKENPRQINHQI